MDSTVASPDSVGQPTIWIETDLALGNRGGPDPQKLIRKESTQAGRFEIILQTWIPGIR